jgi:hypothetical protein
MIAVIAGQHDPTFWIALIVRICSLGIVLSTLEFLRRPSLLSDDGLMSWRICRLDYRWQVNGNIGAYVGRVLSYPVFIALLRARLVVAVLQLVGPRDVILSPSVVAAAAFLTLLLPLRSRMGLDGADQVNLVILGGLLVTDLASTHLADEAYLWFLAVQSCLAYSVAGVAKLLSPGWRDGRHLIDIFQIQNYCHEGVAAFAASHRTVMLAASWGVIGLECGSPLVLLAPPALVITFLCAALLFHIGTAVIMGLNDFVWAFAALYPAVVYCATVRGW